MGILSTMKNLKNSNESYNETNSVNKQPQVLRYSTKDLFGGNNEIVICHKGDLYRIRITRNDKLIMNK